MKFGQLILRNSIKIVATRCQILRLKCTKIDFGWGSAPDPTGELTALPRLPSFGAECYFFMLTCLNLPWPFRYRYIHSSVLHRGP